MYSRFILMFKGLNFTDLQAKETTRYLLNLSQAALGDSFGMLVGGMLYRYAMSLIKNL